MPAARERRDESGQDNVTTQHSIRNTDHFSVASQLLSFLIRSMSQTYLGENTSSRNGGDSSIQVLVYDLI